MESDKIEIWEEIRNYEGLYEISNLGRIRKNGKIKIIKPSKDGYMRANLYKNGKNKAKYVHRLVAEAFIPNPNNYECVNHKDENKQNNCVDNLEWCTYKYNNNYGTCKERRIKKQTNHNTSKIVYQYDLNWNFIKEWPSTMEIQRKLKLFNTSISDCCLGKNQTCGGFKWKYKIDIEKQNKQRL